MNTIELFRLAGSWQARMSDPRVVELFGTDVLPTPFAADTPAETVQARIQALNPGAVVEVSQ